MSTSPEPQKREHPSTYVVQDQQNKDELARLTFQDQMITDSMGGVLPEQDNPASFRRVLDVGCGSGGWVIKAAKTYPEMSVVGIDISQHMVGYAREQAAAHGVAARTEFFVMDALRMLEFLPDTFDLANLRFGSSFLRTWDWPKMLQEMQRVTRPGGVVRIVETEALRQYDDPMLGGFDELVMRALFRSGHLFEEESTGLTAHLPRLLTQYGCRNVQSKAYSLEYRGGTEQGRMQYEDGVRAIQTLRPFLQKWGCLPDDFDAMTQRILAGARKDTFRATWNVLAVWGIKVSA